MSATSVFDVLVVGCGNIAGGFDAHRSVSEPPLTHAGAFSRHPGFRLSACVEPDDDRRRAFMARWNVPLGFATMAQAMAYPLTPSVVSICSPTAAHAAGLEAALAMRPRAIFCEKPVTPSGVQTERWIGACEDAGVLLAVNHTRRWAPDIVRLKQQFEAGEWGQLRSIAGVYNKGILNNGGHLVDLIMALAGPMRLIATGPSDHDFWPDDPTISALLETESGVAVTFSCAHAADYSLFELQLVTQRGVLIMENGGMNWRVRKSVESPHFAGYRSLGAAEETPGEYAQAMSAAISNLHGAIAHGEPLASTGQSALQAQRVCEQIRDAARASKRP